MAEQTPESASLPDAPNLDWLRKEAKRRLEELRRTDAGAQLAHAQFELAKQYGFSSWRALKSHVDSLTVKGRLFDAARNGDVGRLTALLETDPDGLYARTTPYEHTLLHLAAAEGHLEAVELLLRLGLDVNSREKGDNTYPMHWAAAAGHADVVRQLADAGGDVVGSGDDHELEVIGWATCWDEGHDAVQRSIADFLVSRGARHHIFSAVALGLDDEVRRIVATSPGALSQRMSRHENHRLPLHFAVLKNRRETVELLLELGADPTAADGGGFPPSVYAAAPDIDRSVIETLARHGGIDLFGALVLGDEQTAARILAETGSRVGPGGVSNGALHLLAKRGDTRAVRWLLDHGADPNARWSHWDAEVHRCTSPPRKVMPRSWVCSWRQAPTHPSATPSTTATRRAGPSTGGFHAPPSGGRSSSSSRRMSATRDNAGLASPTSMGRVPDPQNERESVSRSGGGGIRTHGSE